MDGNMFKVMIFSQEFFIVLIVIGALTILFGLFKLLAQNPAKAKSLESYLHGSEDGMDKMAMGASFITVAFGLQKMFVAMVIAGVFAVILFAGKMKLIGLINDKDHTVYDWSKLSEKTDKEDKE